MLLQEIKARNVTRVDKVDAQAISVHAKNVWSFMEKISYRTFGRVKICWIIQNCFKTNFRLRNSLDRNCQFHYIVILFYTLNEWFSWEMLLNSFVCALMNQSVGTKSLLIKVYNQKIKLIHSCSSINQTFLLFNNCHILPAR